MWSRVGGGGGWGFVAQRDLAFPSRLWRQYILVSMKSHIESQLNISMCSLCGTRQSQNNLLRYWLPLRIICFSLLISFSLCIVFFFPTSPLELSVSSLYITVDCPTNGLQAQQRGSATGKATKFKLSIRAIRGPLPRRLCCQRPVVWHCSLGDNS